MSVKLFFKNFDPIEISVDNTKTGNLYIDIVKQHYQKQNPHFVDNIGWSVERLIELAKIAKKELNWNWLKDEYTIDITAQLHKDLEHSIGVHGFESIPEKYDWLFYELHHCLHSIQFGKKEKSRNCNLQVEWFTDDYHVLPDDFVFADQVNTGDVILINPYVGHNPLQIYMEQDYEDLDSTVKFHDKIKPAVVISSFGFTVDKQKILKTFMEKDPEFVKKHTADKILYYTGAAKIGHVTNLDQYYKIINHPQVIEFEKLEIE